MLRVSIYVLLALAVLPLVEPPFSAESTTIARDPQSDAVDAGRAQPDAALRTRWEWPIPAPHPIVRPYVAPDSPYSAGHRGIDIAVGANVEVRAPADGVVHFAGTVVDRPVISIRHPGGLISSFEPVMSTLDRGDVVTAGQVIGQAQAGHCVRLCVHFGVRLDGEYVSPLNYLSGTPRAVLLPRRNP